MAEPEVEFEDNSIHVKNALSGAINEWLHEAAGELASQTQRNSRVDTGKTKGDWKYKITGDKLSGFTATIGNPDENAIWEELGTGNFALNGDGRQTPWYVPVDDYMGAKKPTYNGKVVIVIGKNGKKFYKTNGKKPSRAFWKAFTKTKSKIINSLKTKLKGAMK